MTWPEKPFRSGKIWCRYAGRRVSLDFCKRSCELINAVSCPRRNYAIIKCVAGSGNCADCECLDICVEGREWRRDRYG